MKGKGGLVREVLIPFQLARELESRRLTQPKVVTDRGIRYTSQYDISAGMYFSRIFSETSKKALQVVNGSAWIATRLRSRQIDRTGRARPHPRNAHDARQPGARTFPSGYCQRVPAIASIQRNRSITTIKKSRCKHLLFSTSSRSD